MKKVVKEGTQRHLSCASPASQMRLTMRGTYVGATLWPRFFFIDKNTDLILHKYFEQFAEIHIKRVTKRGTYIRATV